uniref:MSP domain-containing protein n=1 Tax=Dunaliella tertiolecta TaxID=3047 RepID=A0A7S3VQW3_DUNTE|mmetsp:Transcript_10357/g.28298  ORF Transcript_10357/g.28298 Transcript_10357/m.28298 type:complete len:242 (-) Transcript_10357:1102-1827(-)
MNGGGSADKVQVQPAELRFRLVLGKQLLATILISNPLDNRVAFKIKTTAPKKYVVRPSSGIAEAKSQVNVQVIMQAQKEYPPDFQNCRDKFMIQVTPLEGDETLDKDTFNKDLRRDMQEHRLKVVMESPAAPPSPVPEANEGDAEAEGGFKHTAGDSQSPMPAPAPAPAGNGASQEALKLQLDRVKREREDLRKKLDEATLQGGPMGSRGKTDSAALKSRVKVVHIILVAIIAFLIGHFTH